MWKYEVLKLQDDRHLSVDRCLLPLTIRSNNCGCHLTHLEIFLSHIFCIVHICNTGQNIWSKLRKKSEIGQGCKTFISAFAYFFTAITKLFFRMGGFVLPILRFFEYFLISWGPNSFDNSWCNSYTQFFLLDIKFCFIYGESDLY